MSKEWIPLSETTRLEEQSSVRLAINDILPAGLRQDGIQVHANRLQDAAARLLGLGTLTIETGYNPNAEDSKKSEDNSGQ